MNVRTEKFPLTVSAGGVSAKIRKVSKIKGGKKYHFYIVDYVLLGKRQQEWRAKFSDARQVALNACRKIADGEQISLTLTNTDRMAYLRAGEALLPVGVRLDVAAHEYASATKLLGGRATLTEACQDWLKRHAIELPRVSIKKAVDEIVQQAEVNGRSTVRVRQLDSILGRFARDCNLDVQDVTPALLSQYLSGLPLSERSKRNYRDTLGFLNRFCVMRGYLQKGTDWLEGVQKYTARKMGAIEIYSPDEMKVLLSGAGKQLVPFLAISAFAGLRHTEIARLDWSQIEDGTGETFIEVRSIENTKSDQRRRLVPIRDNLKAWLLPYRKAAGKVCPFEDIPKQLLKTARRTKIKWKHNALRHSCISYRVAESGNVPLVSDESGNSVSVIRTNYLRRVKPTVAAEWFGIMPPRKTLLRKIVR